MLSNDITLDSVIGFMMECFDRFQNAGDKEGKVMIIFHELIFFCYSLEWVADIQSCSCGKSLSVWWLCRLLQDCGSICWKVRMNHSVPLFAFHGHFRLEDSDIPTTLEILLVIKSLLEHTQIPPGNFISDTMVSTLR